MRPRAWSLWKVEDTRRTSCLQCIWLTALIHNVFPFAEGASALTVTGDCICFDSLPSQYSAHEGFFLFSANKPIPGHKLQNISAPDVRRRTWTLCSCECVFGYQVFGLFFPFFKGQSTHSDKFAPQALAAAVAKLSEVFEQIDSRDHMRITHCLK